LIQYLFSISIKPKQEIKLRVHC